MDPTVYDAIIIGSGQAANPLAHKLADRGWQVALIEREYLGGSCINYGCTPTKTMLASARVAHQARRAADFGVETGRVSVRLSEVVARKNRIVQEWREGQQQYIEERPSLDLYRGVGRFSGPRTITVNDVELSASHIFINTGARPRIPDIPGLKDVNYLTNHNVMDLQEPPAHLIVLGGSYIGLEFGQMYRRFGSQVTVVEYAEQLIPREDEDVARALQMALAKEGITFALSSRATQVASQPDGVAVTIETNEGHSRTISGSHLLLAVGRLPNSDALNLEAAGIDTDEQGHIRVNERLETNVPGVWALGDVKGGPAFTHISYDDHLIVYENLIEGGSRTISDRLVPYALFTDPELGRVGMTEKEAEEAGHRLKVGSVPMTSVARAIERGETEGLMKVVINAENDRILGAAILGSEGGELVQLLTPLMMADAPWTLLEKAVYIHPTLAEGFFTLMDNVEEKEPESTAPETEPELEPAEA
jgi:pyruvate/2-oxoglutarate dehydrogenase complex dihydrolipoamide dehydrogenase (E3) component